MKRELLLLFKTNNYLRAIDLRLRSPGNTFTVINQVTWEVYCQEILPLECKHMGFLSRNLFYARHMVSYRLMQFLLWLQGVIVRLKAFLGIQVTDEELRDFELDDFEFD